MFIPLGRNDFAILGQWGNIFSGSVDSVVVEECDLITSNNGTEYVGLSI